jgi:hypothetical protein
MTTEAAAHWILQYVHFPRSKAGVLDHVACVYLLRDAEPQGQGISWLE